MEYTISVTQIIHGRGVEAYLGQGSTIVERIIADARHALRDGYAREVHAIAERRIADARTNALLLELHADDLWGGWGGIVGRRREQIGRNFGHVYADDNSDAVSVFARIVEHTISVIQIIHGRGVEAYLGQGSTIVERRIADARHTRGDCDACENFATSKRIIANARHALRDGYAREAVTLLKRITSDARYAVSHGTRGRNRNIRIIT